MIIRFSTILIFLICTDVARARVYDIYRSDYTKGPFCSSIAGACAADLDFDNGFFQNPATLESGRENWDYDYDFKKSNSPEPGMQADNKVSESVFMAGALWAGPVWGYGFSVAVQNNQVQSTSILLDQNNRLQSLDVEEKGRVLMFSFPVAYRYSEQLAFGAVVSFLSADRSVDIANGQANTTPMSNLPALSMAFGGIYKANENWRHGLWVKLPMTYGYNLDIRTNSFGNTINYNEDVLLKFPWIINWGASFMPFNDERALSMELDFVGSTANGYLQSYDAFTATSTEKANSYLVKKGENIVVEPRLGWKSAWGRGSQGTYMMGTYYENSRWQNESGRFHLTGGLSYKWGVNFFIFDGIEFMVGFDVANNYQQVFITYR